ncbi:MAG: hypothetical protein AAF743_09080, partial [Planctomycetota bacterium]
MTSRIKLFLAAACVAPNVLLAQPTNNPNPPAEPAAPAEPAPVTDDAIDEWTDIFTKGTFSANFRFRYGFAEVSTPGGELGDSHAFTLRTRLGYGTKPVYGLSGFIELEDIRAADYDQYNAAGLNGQPGLSVIADPEDTELNQLFLKWSVPKDLFEGDDLIGGSEVILGRQRIILDNSRFVGNVGWRQNEQTFDAAVFNWKPESVEGLSVFYSFVDDVNRIFGPDSGRDFDSQSHLINASYKIENVGKLVVFAYLLDFDNALAASSQTYGVLLTGDRKLDDDYTLKYVASYAFQQDFADNPIDYDAHYLNGELTLAKKGTGSVAVGYELLGSDDGNIGFSTPLATLHKFNGFADAFLATPATGLQDVYASVGADLPWGMKGKVIGHYFFDHEDAMDLGWEVDAVVTKKINDNLSLLAKAAYFDGTNNLPDIVR